MNLLQCVADGDQMRVKCTLRYSSAYLYYKRPMVFSETVVITIVESIRFIRTEYDNYE